jgi:hypothetical protein
MRQNAKLPHLRNAQRGALGVGYFVKNNEIRVCANIQRALRLREPQHPRRRARDGAQRRGDWELRPVQEVVEALDQRRGAGW